MSDDHDRLIRLEERVAQWIIHVERTIAAHRAVLLWLLGSLAAIATGVVTALLLKSVE